MNVVDHVTSALQRAGLPATTTGPHIDVTVGDRTVRLAVASPGDPPTEHSAIVVVDQPPAHGTLPGDAAGWYCPNGTLHINHDGLVIHLDTSPDDDVPGPAPTSVDPFAGAVVSALTVMALTAYPDPLPGVRETARRIGRTAGGVSLAIRRLEAAGLLTADRVAAVPGLFSRAVANWHPTWTSLAGVPAPTVGVHATGTLAAARLGAPVVAQSGAPVELVADTPAAYRAAVRSVPADLAGPTAARITLAPSPLADLPKPDAIDVAGHPIAPTAIIALTIALDRARGAEILDDWEHDGRVW